MKRGFVYPGGKASDAVRCAQAAEAAGWDGFFVWEPLWGVDAWATLAAVAVSTSRIRLGTMVTPITRRRPWKLAGETLAVDELSNGRLILSVGLGAPETGWASFGEETDRKRRAERTDEGLAILTGLWQGQPFAFSGAHYTVTPLEFANPHPPVQQPRIPIWVVGALGRPKSLARVLKYDGILPTVTGAESPHPTPALIREFTGWLADQAIDRPFDIVLEGDHSEKSRDEEAETMGQWAAAGATWWLEAMWGAIEGVYEPAVQEKIIGRILRG